MQVVEMNNKIIHLVLIFLLALVVSSCQTSLVNDNLEGKAGELVGTLDGYEFYRESITCDLVIGNITIDNYNFGYFGSACGDTLDDIGYDVKKNDETFRLQDLVDKGELKTKDIFNRIYKPDPFKKGEL